MSEFTIAKRENLIPLIGLFGKSASGKTLSGLKIARGLVGPNGKICVTDTENGRAAHFADDPSVAPYFSLDLQPPYSPAKYLECHESAIKAGANVHLIDSGSHEWTGEGGCLQMLEQFLDQKAKDDWAKRDKLKMAAWAFVTPKHEAWVNALMRSPIPTIVCFRAKDKIVMEKVEGATKITTDFDAPIARKDLIYEMLLAFECHQADKDGVQSGGYFHVRKPGPPSLHKKLMEFKDERLSPKIGQLIAEWCSAPVMPGTPIRQSDDLKSLKLELWKLTADQHHNDKVNGQQMLNQFLIDEGYLSDTETVAEIPADRLRTVIAKLKEKLK